MSSSTRSPLVFTTYAALVATLGILVVYGGHIDIGLYYDDYHFVRPWSAVELRRVWFGSWDPTGIEAVYFRPITAWLFAARFWVFGLNAAGMHVLSVAGHGLCAVLVGWFVRRERVATGIALLGVWLYAVHPLLPYAQVSWLTNQMHLAESIVVLITLLVWQAVRDRPLVWWIPIAGLAVIAFLIKEDGVMLLPAIATLTLLRVWLIGASPPRPWPPLLVGAVLIVAALIGLRYEQLGRLGGHVSLSLDQAQTNIWKGLKAALLLWPTKPPWQAIASGIGIGALVAGLALGKWRLRRRVLFLTGIGLALGLCLNLPSVFQPRPGPYPLVTWPAVAGGIALSALVMGPGVAMWRADRHALFVIGAGLALALCFNMPFILVSKREQYHLLALGAVLVFVGASRAMWTAVARRTAQMALGILLVAPTIPLCLWARNQAADFLPCAPNVLSADEETRGWWAVPDEIRPWLDLKAERCRAGLPPLPVSALPIVAWGVYGVEHDQTFGMPFRWTGDWVVLLVRRTATSMAFAMRRPGATAGHPIWATIRAGGRTTTVTLDSGDWRYATVTFRPTPLAWLRDGQRVDLSVTPWFVPAVLDPSSPDLRRLGVELRIVDVR